MILAKAAEYAKSDTLNFLAASFGRLPAPEYADRQTILARHRDKAVLKGLLARLCLEEPAIARSAGPGGGGTEREHGCAG